MREKLDFLEKRFGKRNGSQRFCETVCMRSVNQAIGRAIRHVDDYAVVFLLDKRFTTSQRLRLLLPKWAHDALVFLPSSNTTTTNSPSQLEVLRLQLHNFFLNAP